MNIQEHRELLAEKATLENLLKQLPESSVIEHMSLEAREREVEELLASQQAPAREPVRVRLTFRGKPIVGSHGMFAEFGAKAVNAFADAVAAIGASQTTALGARGTIPNREHYQLLITGTALGSFGFELEEAPKDEMLFPEMSLVESAIAEAKAIMEASLGTDNQLTDAISETAPRAIEALRSFLKTMLDQEAVCGLEFQDDVFCFADVEQVRRSEGRLSQDNIHEEDTELTGRFQGVLPHRRTFEFQISDTEEFITGKVGPGIDYAGGINHILEKTLKITVHTKRAGEGRPRYVLLSYEEPLTNNEEEASK